MIRPGDPTTAQARPVKQMTFLECLAELEGGGDIHRIRALVVAGRLLGEMERQGVTGKLEADVHEGRMRTWRGHLHMIPERRTTELAGQVKALRAELAAERARAERVAHLFREYGFHKGRCAYADHMGECDCGYPDAELEVGYDDADEDQPHP